MENIRNKEIKSNQQFPDMTSLKSYDYAKKQSQQKQEKDGRNTPVMQK
jgi:hypothetical protein